MVLQNKEKKMKLLKKGILLVFSSLAFATFTISDEASAAELSVSSNDISQEKIEIAKENWENYANNLIMDTNNQLTDFYLGNGFTVDNLDTTNFPIIEKKSKDISYILQIDQNNQILISTMYAAKLNELSLKKSDLMDNPVHLVGYKQSIFINDGYGHLENLIGNDNTSPNILKRATEDQPKSVVNLTGVLENPDQINSTLTAPFDHVVLPWKSYEIQTDKPWCEWYAISSIMNNMSNKKVISAEALIKQVYPKATSSQLNDINWIVKQNLNDTFNCVKNKYGMNLVVKSEKPNFTTIKNEIKTRKTPMIVDLTEIHNKPGHALVQIGYTASSSTSNAPYYYYWNPWWEDTFVVSSSASYMQLSQYQYTPSRSITNFTKPKI